MLSVVEKQLGGKSGHSDVLQVLFELLLVGEMVHGGISEGLKSDISGRPPTLNDNLGVNFLLDELLGLSQEFSGEHGNCGCAVTDLLILSV